MSNNPPNHSCLSERNYFEIPDNFKYIVFSGGAARGFAHIGVLNVLESLLQIYGKVMLEHLEGFGGSSFGAIIALACSLELKFDIIREWFLNVDTEKIVAKMDFVRIINENGLIPNSVLIEKVEDLIHLRFGNANYTFKELHNRTKTHLRIVVSNLTKTTIEVWDHITHPNYLVKIATAASMAIPGVFDPFVINGCLYGDGGFYCGGNYPITIFPSANVLGIRIEGGSTLEGTKPPLSQYAMHMVFSPMEFSEKMMLSTISEEYKRHTISVTLPTCGVLDLINPPKKLRQDFIKKGEEAAMDYFIENTFLVRVIKMLIHYNVMKRSSESQSSDPEQTSSSSLELLEQSCDICDDVSSDS